VKQKRHSELVNRTLYIFNDLLVCAANSKQSTKLKIAWKAKLINCNVTIKQTDDGGHQFEITELRVIKRDPFVTEKTWTLRPAQPPYDFSFWKNSLDNALGTFQWDKDRLLLENSIHATRHMKQNLVTARDWSILQYCVKKLAFSLDEIILSNVRFFLRFFSYFLKYLILKLLFYEY
jgi:hypothetical protein